ncbi:stalk domain-containing protein [Paenibacillus bouchesdurhonensis]|uniref:stalk domain-containing protein n=1 Tax=Paenibacillus bouchesdurhonensis TaxID=1870990 RepID=UPI000DA639AF|nr:stalk domain-containing protein [Paenibacillus bouchesdurhonensis]
MRRMARILLSITAVLTLSISTLVGSAMPVVAANASGDPEGDIAKMYRVKHELKFDMKGTSATLDGKAVHADKPILKDGRVFVPLRTLQESGAAASISWDAKKREAQIVMKPQIAPNWQKLSFRIGSDQIYLPDGETIAGEKIPKPFLANGRTYIPVKPLSWLGVAASLNEGTVTWNWSEKIIEVMTPNWETGGETAAFSMLYQEDMYAPQFLYPFGSGGWGGGTGIVTAKGIELDGRKYNRMEFTTDLRPGINPMQLYAISAGTADFTVLRKISDPGVVPVRLTEEGQQYITLDRPMSGYLEARSKAEISIEGTIVKPYEHFDQVTVMAQKYAPKSGGLGHEVYTTVSTNKLPIKDNKFSGTIQVEDPGYYLIMVISPGYLAAPERDPMSTVWAEFIVKVE